MEDKESRSHTSQCVPINGDESYEETYRVPKGIEMEPESSLEALGNSSLRK